MRRNTRSETHHTSRGASARESARASRDLGARGLVSCLLVLITLYQPSFAVAGSLVGLSNARVTTRTQGQRGGILIAASSAAAAARDAFGYVSSLFASGEAAPAESSSAAEPLPTPTPITDAAISRNAPTLTGGRVEGTLRVFGSQNYTLNSPFHVTGDVYTVGTPNIVLNGNATHGGVVDDSGAQTPTGYSVTLGSGIALPGKIHRRADAFELPPVPTSVPTPTGTRSLNINSQADVANIGAWNTVRDLNVSGVAVNAPPGNYGTFTVNGTGRINLSAGTYNFTGPMDLNGNASVQITGKVTINIGQGVKVGDDFSINSGSILAGPNTLPGDVLINVLGTAFAINGTGQVTGIIRAPNATVTFNGNNSLLRGQVIAGWLVMKGGKIIGDTSVTPPPDSVPPTIQIVSPENNSTTTAATVNVVVVAADPGLQATGVAAVFVNDAPATFDAAAGQWKLQNVPVTLGPNTINVRAVDGVGNQATASVNVTRVEPPDTTNPTVNINSPANNSSTDAETVTVSGTSADPGTPSSGVARVTVNGAEATLSGGNWTINGVALAVGPNAITAVAYDTAGNQSAPASINVTRTPPADTSAPQISITSPANNFETIDTLVTVSGTASDPGQYQSGVSTVTVNGISASYEAATGQWTALNVPLTIGSNTITATATDGAGNTSTPASINVTRKEPPDESGPALSITSPADNSTTDAEAVTVAGTVSDPGQYQSGVARVTVNGVEATLAPDGTWTASGVSLALGPNTINVRADDRAGNQTVKTVNVTRVLPPDRAKPNLVVSVPADGSTTDALTTNVAGTVSDTGVNASGVASVTVNGAAATLNASNGSWSFENFALALGENVINVRATDHAGNEAHVPVKVTRVLPPDHTAPELTITSPADGVTVPDETINVTGTATDEGLGAAGVATVTVNGVQATYNSSTKIWSATGVPLVEGPNTITVVATDAAPAANSREASITVTRRTPDRDAPLVVIASPLPGFETYAAAVDVSGTAIDEGLNATGVVRVTVNNREAAYDQTTRQWTLGGLALEYGENTIVVVATDGATPPLAGRSEVRVTRKRIPPPAITITNPVNGGVYPASTITVAGTISSLSSDPVVVTVNGQPAGVNGLSFVKTVTLVEGTNTINVTATDSLGQQTQSSVSILRDQTPPVVSFVSAPTLVQPGASYQITVEASDNVGVADVEFSVNGERVGASSAAPYQFTLNVPSALAAGNVLTLSATARDLGGASATATAQTRTTGPGGISGYVFDDATGYSIEGAQAAIAGETSATTDAAGTYGLVSSNSTGVVRLTKDGYTSAERIYAVTPGEGSALLDARLTPLDSKANLIGPAGGAATGDAGRLRVEFAAGVFASETDVRITSISPQGLVNLLPYGWSPVPGAVVDVRAGAAAFQTPARLRIASTPVQLSGVSLTFARYDEQTHGWRVVVANMTAAGDGSLEVEIQRAGQYAFLVADKGATAPPPAAAGEVLPSSAPADSAALDAATASAVPSPAVAAYSAQARSTISFLASAPTALPSGVAIEATFGETYTLLGGKDSLFVDRPQQDFILYSFPAASVENPNRLGADFIAKPTRTEFSISELLGANVHVDIRSGRQAKTGVLVGPSGGVVRAGDGATLQVPADSVGGATPVFFETIAEEAVGLTLPEGYEQIAAFELTLSGTTLSRGATISVPSPAGDNSRVVVARVLNVGGRVPEVVARAVESGGRLVSTTSQPAVPAGVALRGVTTSGRYVLIRVPVAFGYATGLVNEGGAPAGAAKVTDDRTPFVYVTGADGRYAVVGAAGEGEAGANQVGAQSTTSDATGQAAAALAAQNSVAVANITLASAPLRVLSVSPAGGAANMVVTTPVTVTFNKPIAPASLTASAFKLSTAGGNPVLGTVTVLAGNRVAVLTPAATLAASTQFVVSVSQAVRDVYGRPLEAPFTSNFTTAAPVAVAGRMKPEQIRIDYPDATGMSRVTVPANSVPDGSVVVAINSTSGSTVTQVAGTSELVLNIAASVGDEIVLTVRQPDGTEYEVKQAAYRRADGFTSVGANGGTVLGENNAGVLVIPPGAITGQADIKMTPRTEADIPITRTGGLEPSLTRFAGGVQIRAEGTYTNEKELHLEIPAPPGATEGEVAMFLSPIKVKDESGQMVDVWDSVTSGRVKGGKVSSNSPPFYGIACAAFLELFVFMPTFHRIVSGQVRSFPTREFVPDVTVLAGSYNTGWYGRMVGRTRFPDGRFTLFEVAVAPPDERAIPLKAYDDLNNRQAVSTAVGAQSYEMRWLEGLTGFAFFQGDILLPAVPNTPGSADPPVIQVASFVGGPPALDPLFTRGVAPVGNTAYIVATTDRKLAQVTGSALVAGVTTRQLTWTEQENEKQEPPFRYEAPLEVTAEGSYAVTIKGSTIANDPTATTTVVHNFVGLRNPNTRPPLPGPPSVIHVTPADGAESVEVTTDIRVEFSEPVRNLVPGDTIYLQEEGSEEKIGGSITSGGLVVTPDSEAVSSIAFRPTSALAGGKTFTVHVTGEVVDETNDGLDQNYTGSGDASKQSFESKFATFEGLVLTDKPLAELASRITVVGNYAYTVGPFSATNVQGSRLNVYDVTDPQSPVLRGTHFIPQRAFDLSVTEAEEDAFTVNGRVHTRIAAIVTSAPLHPLQHANVWFYSLDEPSTPELVGVTSLYLPQTMPSTPLSVRLHKGRAYVGSSPYRGISAVDVAHSVKLYAEGIRKGMNPMVEAVKAPSGTTGLTTSGFGQEAKVQTVTYEQVPSAGSALAAPSISVMDGAAQVGDLPPGFMPIVYVANNTFFRLLDIGFPRGRDNRNGLISQNGVLLMDDRVIGEGNVNPRTAMPSLVRTAKGVFVDGLPRNLALLLSGKRLWIFDVNNPHGPVQYPSKSFEEMGIAGSARYFDIEGTLAYVVMDNDIVVVDFSDPRNPRQVVRLTGLGASLRSLAVKDGFIYSLSPGSGETDGLNVSIAVPTSRLYVAGASADPGLTCSGPVVLDRATNVMRQAVSVNFQVFGRKAPTNLSVVIRKGEQVVGSVPAALLPSSTERASVGHAEWNSPLPIDRAATYTAELLLDQGSAAEYRSLREPIPFAYLIEHYSTQMALGVEGGSSEASDKTSYGYVLGAAANVTLTVNGQQVLSDLRGFGLNVEQPALTGLAPGRYPFTLRAEMAGGSVSDQVSGTLHVTRNGGDARPPGHTLVGGVDLATGNLAETVADIPEIKNRGLGLSFVRSYNSSAANAFTPLGYGWHHNYAVLLTARRDATGATTYSLRGGDGSGQRFKAATPTGFLAMKAEKPHHGTLHRNADGSFDFYTPGRVRHHFPGALAANDFNFYDQSYMGNLEWIQEPNGNRLQLTYDAQGRMTSVTDSSGRQLEFTYEAAASPFAGVVAPVNASRTAQSCVPRGQFHMLRTRFVKAQVGQAWRIKEVRGPAGLRVTYDHDADGNLVKVTRAGTDDISAATSAAVWLYAYKPSDPSATVETTHLLKSSTNPNERTTNYEYLLGQLGAPVKAVSRPEGAGTGYAYSFDSANRPTSVVVTDGRGAATTYTLGPDGYTTAVNAPRGATTTMAFNAEGLKTRETDPLGTTTTYEYDAKGNLRKQTWTGGDGSAAATETTYHPTFAKPISTRDANGNLTTYALDARGNVTLITLPTGATRSFDYQSNGDLLQATDERGLATTFTYDTYGNPQTVTQQTSPGSTIISELTHDARSRLTASTDSVRPSVARTYDALDRVVTETVTDPTGFRAAVTTVNTYSPGGQLLSSARTGGDQSLAEQYTYDGLDRMTRADADISGVSGRLSRSFSYDENSNLKSETDRRGVTTSYEYDPLNFAVSARLTGPAGDVQTTTAEPNLVGDHLSLTDHYGQTTTFQYDGLRRLRVRKLPGGYTEEQSYDANGNVVSSKDRNGRVTTTTYDPLNRPATLRDPAGRTQTWTYNDAAGSVAQLWTPQNRTVTETTDALGRLLRREVGGIGVSYTTRISYAGRTRTTIDARGNSSHEDLAATGEVANSVARAAGQTVRTESRYGALGGLASFKDANGHTTTYELDGLGRPLSSKLGQFTQSWKYDGEGHVLSHTDRRGIASAMTYDNLGRELTRTVGGINVLSVTYDGLKETRKDANGRATVLGYDGLRRLTSVTNAELRTRELRYDGMNLRSEGDFKGNSASYQYDAADRVIEARDRAGQVTLFWHDDSNGYKRTTTDRRVYQRVESFDALGRLKTVFDNDGTIASYDYDGNNNRTLAVDGRQNSTVYTYDELNRVTSCDHAGVQLETFGHDPAGNLISHDDGRGEPVRMEYDELGHLKARTDGAGNRQTFRHDGGGLLVEKTEPKADPVNGQGFRTTYEYNALGSLVKVTDAEQRFWEFEYDNNQNLTSVTDARFNKTRYEYDALDRLKTVTRQSMVNQPNALFTSYEYDQNSNRTIIRDQKGQVFERVYDNLDRLTLDGFVPPTVTGHANSGLVDRREYGYDPEGNVTNVVITRGRGQDTQAKQYSRAYDLRGRLRSTTDEFGKTVGYLYDEAGNVKRLTDAAGRETNYVYDGHNRLKKAELPGGRDVDFEWFADGLLHRVKYGAGLEREYTYDAADRVARVSNTVAFDGTVKHKDEFAYEYDPNSNVEKETRTYDNAPVRTARYEYDHVNRLTRATHIVPGGAAEGTSLAWQYDAAGNRTSESGTTPDGQPVGRTYQYDALNRLTQMTDGGAAYRYEYDDNGNLTAAKVGDGQLVSRYDYDLRDHLRAVRGAQEQELARYDYDYAGRRTQKVLAADSSEQRYAYDGLKVLDEFDGRGRLTASYDYGAGPLRADFAGEGERFFFADRLGSTSSLSQITQAGEQLVSSQVASYGYDAWGSLASSSTGASNNTLLYTGQRLDRETGWMPLGAGTRFYAPGFGRFTQQDTYTGELAQPQTLNRYAYGLGNPLRYTDPTGRQSQDENERSWGDVASDVYEYAKESIKENVTELINYSRDIVTAARARWNGVDAENIVFRSRLARDQQAAFLSGESRFSIASRTFKQVVFSGLTFGIGPRVISQLENARDLAQGRITVEEYDERFLRDVGGLVGDLFMSAAGAKLGRVGRAVTKESGLTASVARASLRGAERLAERAGRLGERIAPRLKPGNYDWAGMSRQPNMTFGIPRYKGPGTVDSPAIAFGKERGLLDFADDVRAVSWYGWHEVGLVSRAVQREKFGIQFYRAAYRAGRIKFNIEGVDVPVARSMERSLARKMDPILHAEIGVKKLTTEWELRQILSNRKLYDKTDFYYGSAVKIKAEDAALFGVEFMGW